MIEVPILLALNGCWRQRRCGRSCSRSVWRIISDNDTKALAHGIRFSAQNSWLLLKSLNNLLLQFLNRGLDRRFAFIDGCADFGHHRHEIFSQLAAADFWHYRSLFCDDVIEEIVKLLTLWGHFLAVSLAFFSSSAPATITVTFPARSTCT